ncbi:MAG: glycerophosphodiester phosphodiesterase [Sandaracinaceae bacterium]
MSRPLVWAHRGVHDVAVENTMAAFEAAIAVGADGVELDVRATADGEVVVFHDADLLRLAGDPRAIAACARAALPEVGGAPIPTLDEVLDRLLGAGLEVNVELKAGPAATAAVLARRSDADRARIVLSSFDAAMLLAVTERVPVRGALLFEHADAVTEDLLAKVDGLHPHFGACTPERVDAWRVRGRFVNVWTVNDPDLARALAAMDVDGLVTDRVGPVRGACEMCS